MVISQTQAEEWFREDLERFESYVEGSVEAQLNDNQFSGLVCFCFNVAPESFRDSTLLKLLNQGDYPEAANQFPVWNKVNGEAWLGLTRRRLAEQALFLGKAWQPFLNYEETTVLVLKLTELMMQPEDVRRVQEALRKVELISSWLDYLVTILTKQ